jgi:translocating chain-associated membrane protein 1|uniref:Translocating chain-associated membrane protein n=1 Tax=Acrobeloides nanus TaxID=290746 RepID=A0A914DER9_9BILA
MGIESRRAATRPKKASPPILSHEFIIQNHGDIMSCILMLVILGFMFQITAPLAQIMVVPQYNETIALPKDAEPQMYYRSGLRDLPSLFFYTIAWITAHCILQEYILDKIQRRLHLSKTRMSKFNESGHLFAFCAYSAGHAGYILHEMGIHKDVTQLWIGYPDVHRYLPLTVKIFFILQITYWLHQFPEFYFMKVKREEIRARTFYSVVFLLLISGAYFASFTRLALVLLFLEYTSQAIFHLTRVLYFTGKIKNAGNAFKLWNAIFVIVRFASVVLSVLTLWYGFRSNETPVIDFATGNFNTSLIRINSLIIVVGLQIFMLWNFFVFHFARFRERHRESETAQQKHKKQKHAKKVRDDSKDSSDSGNESTSKKVK